LNTHQTSASPAPETIFRVRASDPVTSVMAAESAEMFAGKHKDRIRLALTKLKSATAHDIARVTGLTVVQVDRRLPELKRDGVADVVEASPGVDLLRDGFRVWALKKISTEEQQEVAEATGV